MTTMNSEHRTDIGELTDSELDLANGGTSNNVGSFVHFVESLTLTACEACYRVISDHY
jgi:hypothetical protein